MVNHDGGLVNHDGGLVNHDGGLVNHDGGLVDWSYSDATFPEISGIPDIGKLGAFNHIACLANYFWCF